MLICFGPIKVGYVMYRNRTEDTKEIQLSFYFRFYVDIKDVHEVSIKSPRNSKDFVLLGCHPHSICAIFSHSKGKL